MEKFAIILAAGKGTRMKSADKNRSKVSYEILKKPLVKYVVDALKPLKLDKIITVVGYGGDETKRLVEKDSEIVWQHEQRGTGHAVMQAESILSDKEGYTIVCCGDTPVVTEDTFQKLLEEHINSHDDLTVLTAFLDNPQGYGRIKRGEHSGKVKAIVEQADCDETMINVKEVNAGIYVFDNKALFSHLHLLNANNKQGELYLTDLLAIFKSEKLRVGSYALEDYHEMMGVNDRWQLYEASETIKMRTNKRLMLEGVTIIDPKNTYIGVDVVIGKDTIIYPNTHIYGKTIIGSNCVIQPNTIIENRIIGDNEIVSK